jgi:hypothetical protein
MFDDHCIKFLYKNSKYTYALTPLRHGCRSPDCGMDAATIGALTPGFLMLLRTDNYRRENTTL